MLSIQSPKQRATFGFYQLKPLQEDNQLNLLVVQTGTPSRCLKLGAKLMGTAGRLRAAW